MMKFLILNHSIAFYLIILLFLVPYPSFSEESTAHTETDKSSAITAPVVLKGHTLFHVTKIKAFSAENRAHAISFRIKDIAETYTVDPESVQTVDTEISTDIIAEDRIIMSVFDVDAASLDMNRQKLAGQYAEKIRTAVINYRKDYSRESIVSGFLYTAIATVVLIIVALITRKLLKSALSAIETRYQTRIRAIQIQSFEVVRAERIRNILTFILRILKIIIFLLIAYSYLYTVLSLFPWTRHFASRLLEFIIVPLVVMGKAVFAQVPNLLFLVFLVIAVRYILKVMHHFFEHVERKAIVLPNFYQEWAKPTDRILTFIVIAFSVVVAFPYIPGSDSPAFKGVSLFFGILFSLGSQTAIANIIAGVMLTYRRAFRIGDRVKIGEILGDVTEMRLQVTHLRTIKNEEVTLPNAAILSSNVINYASLSRESGLILHTKVTIGYDAPWRQVESLLLLAAERTSGLLKEPRPFVLQLSLDDFYVSYELNAYTTEPHAMINIYSDLHKNIQDAFNEYGVQIMSPHYMMDKSVPTFVPKEKWYEPPAPPPRH